jgi:DNA recombination protein RmuC
MTTILVVLAMALIVGILAVFYEIRKLRSAREQSSGEGQQVLMEWLKEMKEDQRHSTETLQKQVHRTNRELGERLDNAARVVQSVGTEVGKMQEIGQSMKELQSIMKSPKLRGNLGEEVMKDLLKQMLPKDGYKMQHKFKSGDTVDAVVKTKNGLIPLDSKFPVENYLAAQKTDDAAEKEKFQKQFGKDIKAHIDKIAKKYILPAEDTVDFAIMYVPGESVYYEIITNTELANYGEQRKVYLVSPNTFHYFLQTVMVALSGEQIEQQAKQVMVALQAIKGDSQKLGTDLGVLGRHVTNAKNQMENVTTSYQRLGTKIDGASQLQGTQQQVVKQQLKDLSELPEETVSEPAEPLQK